jgi:hypothetical protein
MESAMESAWEPVSELRPGRALDSAPAQTSVSQNSGALAWVAMAPYRSVPARGEVVMRSGLLAGSPPVPRKALQRELQAEQLDAAALGSDQRSACATAIRHWNLPQEAVGVPAAVPTLARLEQAATVSQWLQPVSLVEPLPLAPEPAASGLVSSLPLAMEAARAG